VNKDFSQLYLLLRKNLLVTTLTGMRTLLQEYTPEELQNNTDQLLTLSKDDFSEMEVKWLQPFYGDEDSMIGSTLHIKALGPKVFINICKISGFSPNYFYETLLPTEFLQDAMKNQKFSDGKSGSFFVFSPDKKFIIKTIPRSEYKAMERLLSAYYYHLLQYPRSLLIRILGAYSVTLGYTKVYVLVMNNILTKSINEKYDIKGSWVDRNAEIDSSVKKDNDLEVDFVLRVDPLALGPIIEQIDKDSQLLRDHNIMDYSLLLGLNNHRNDDIFIETLDPQIKEIPKSEIDQFRSFDQIDNYIFGIIDILQVYDASKKAERCIKVYGACKDGEGLSSIPPKEYRLRFLKRIKLLFGVNMDPNRGVE